MISRKFLSKRIEGSVPILCCHLGKEIYQDVPDVSKDVEYYSEDGVVTKGFIFRPNRDAVINLTDQIDSIRGKVHDICPSCGHIWSSDIESSLPLEDIDKACRSLCVALNKLPGVETSESCSGHGKGEYSIFLKMETNNIGAMVLSRCLSGRYYNYKEGELRADPVWRLYLGDTEDLPCFVLEGEKMSDDLDVYEPAEKLAINIEKHVAEDYAKMRKNLMRCIRNV